jgi:hypothetical protein
MSDCPVQVRPFLEGPWCRSGQLCGACRRDEPQKIAAFVGPCWGPPPAECPRGVQLEQVHDRPAPTIDKVISFGRALVAAKRMSLQVVRDRETTCSMCEYAGFDKFGRYCTLCGCATAGRVTNLATYEEVAVNGQVQRGCKHPERNKGMGWRE